MVGDNAVSKVLHSLSIHIVACSIPLANYDGRGQRRLKGARLYQHAYCGMLESYDNYDGRGQRRLNNARQSQHASCESCKTQ